MAKRGTPASFENKGHQNFVTRATGENTEWASLIISSLTRKYRGHVVDDARKDANRQL